jgi:hypothetical protein
VLIATPVAGQQVQIEGTLTNFDVHQGSAPIADNFELDFYGEISPLDFYDFYPGWGSPPRFDEIIRNGVDEGAEVMWLDRAAPIPFCQWVHFGVAVNPALPPMGVRAWWTKVNKEEQIPVPFQWWLVTEQGEIIDVLTLSPTYPEPLRVVRDFARSPVPIPLEEMLFDTTPVVWMPFGETILTPGTIDEALRIPLEPGFTSVLVRYSVYDPQFPDDPPITRFVTQAELVDPLLGPIREVLVNFDLHQWLPDRFFDNVELDLFGDWLLPEMVRSWYAVESGVPFPAWGVPPIVRPFPPGLFPEMPDRGGIEITWVDKFDPFEFCETHHFGLVLDPGVLGPWPAGPPTWVQAYWTTIDRWPVPVPWQFWEAGDGIIRDIIIQGNPDLPPVTVDRQFVTLPAPIPLAGLTWDEVEPLPWEPVPGDPQPIGPSQPLEIDIPVGETDGAVLVRYTVTDETGELTTRVINEALLIPTVGVPESGSLGPWFLAPITPTPSSGRVDVRVGFGERTAARVLVVDVGGRVVASLHEGVIDAGEHVLGWDGRDAEGRAVASGVYFVWVDAGSHQLTRRVVLER